MPALSISQQPEWNNNVYVFATSRILVVIGVAYLIKSLYTLVPLIWGSGSASIVAGGLSYPDLCVNVVQSQQLTYRVVVADGIDLADIASNTPVMVPEAVGTGPDLEANLTLDTPSPQPSYDPRNQTQRFRVITQAQSRSTQASEPSAAAQTMSEQDVGVRNNDSHTEEGMHPAVGLTGLTG